LDERIGAIALLVYSDSMNASPLDLSCPMPTQRYPHILMAHGGGGRLMQQLITDLFLPTFGDPQAVLHDATVLPIATGKIAMTTDSYVVSPLFFPGGDVGSLAIYGTVNDLAMAGAVPTYLSVGFILEEGLAMETLWRIVQSMKYAAEQAQVRIVTGDTKVVERGKGDGIYINTAGVGLIHHTLDIQPRSLHVGDAILLNGDLGRHGMAIMAARHELEFETPLNSDSAPLSAAVQAMLQAGIEIHCLRDLTRGGLSSTLNELAIAAQLGMELEESAIPILPAVQGACEILGFDPLYIANEGRMVVILPAEQADHALDILRCYQTDTTPCRIGTVTSNHPGQVILNSRVGASRVVDMLSGEQLPRIC
jgi:hydrogenase expression/formation protein HypE